MNLLRSRDGGVVAVALLVALALAPSVRALAISAPLTEAQVRAGLLYNFATFVEWPDDAGTDRATFVIGVYGADAVSDALREIEGRPIRGRRLEIRRIAREADARQCHVLYIPASAGNWDGILREIGSAPVLTVGEHPRFTAVGGVIRLYAEDARLKFEINVSRSKEVQLHVSSKLLGLARIVR